MRKRKKARILRVGRVVGRYLYDWVFDECHIGIAVRQGRETLYGGHTFDELRKIAARHGRVAH